MGLLAIGGNTDITAALLSQSEKLLPKFGTESISHSNCRLTALYSAPRFGQDCAVWQDPEGPPALSVSDTCRQPISWGCPKFQE